MVRTLQRLSISKIKSAPVGLSADGGGLYLQTTIRADGGKNQSWLFRYAVGGKERQMGLGSLDVTTLAEARQKAHDARKLRADGVDPLEMKRTTSVATALAKEKLITFDQCADAYIQSHQAGWRSAKHGRQWKASIRDYVSPIFGSVAVRDVTTELVMKSLRPIWHDRPETANRIRGRIEVILDYAKVAGHRSGENPALWRGHISHLLPATTKISKVRHHTAMNYADIPDFMKKLKKLENIAPMALRFAILNASRSCEVLGAKWEEIDLDARSWTIDGTRMKSGTLHRIPLTDAAMSVLNKMKTIRTSGYIFPGTQRQSGLSDTSLQRVLRRLGLDVTPHGFRSSFKTWASECTSTPREIVEMCLAHSVGTAVELAYMRSDLIDRRRKLMDGWAEYCEGIIIPQQITNP